MKPAIVTDVEGTTSAIDFVKSVLFPYARRRMADFVRARADDPAVQAVLDEVRRAAGADLSLEACLAQLDAWAAADAKVTPLKTLQGMIWAEGYAEGALEGHVYPDAAAVLRRWRAAGHPLYVYSSGSVQAQKLLFAHSSEGDLAPLFSGHFDTTVGGKKDPQSYRRIAERLEGAGAPWFLSDMPEELAAAQAAGWRVVQLRRPGEAQPPGPWPQAEDFYGVDAVLAAEGSR
ncbi:MAG: enolase-phosphatase E1 [Gammaproteobacteria bacterium]|nr:MAG: enolase-phosphatase E1 [Gammaproteobacteria bacterium]